MNNTEWKAFKIPAAAPRRVFVESCGIFESLVHTSRGCLQCQCCVCTVQVQTYVYIYIYRYNICIHDMWYYGILHICTCVSLVCKAVHCTVCGSIWSPVPCLCAIHIIGDHLSSVPRSWDVDYLTAYTVTLVPSLEERAKLISAFYMSQLRHRGKKMLHYLRSGLFHGVVRHYWRPLLRIRANAR